VKRTSWSQGLSVTADGRGVRLLRERGDEICLRARADSGSRAARRELARLLAERGDEEGLRARANKGDDEAQQRLVELVARRDAVSELRDLVHAAFDGAAEALIGLYLRDHDSSYLQLDVNAEPRLITLPMQQRVSGTRETG
jgi:hypothetical protein